MKFKNIKNNEYFRKQRKLSMISLSAELPNLFATIAAALISSAVLVWTDALLSLASTMHPLLVVIILSVIIEDNQESRYNYGTERVENLTSFCCDALVVFGLVVMVAVSIVNIVRPSPPSDNLLWYIILKGCNTSFDAYLVLKQLRLRRLHHDGINATELFIYKQNMISDAAVLIGAISCYVFRRYAFGVYISPVLSLALSAWYIRENYRHMRRMASELSDVSKPVGEQERIFDAVLGDMAPLQAINSVNMRQMNSTVFVDIDADFKDSVSCAEERDWLNRIYGKIKEQSDAKYRVFLVHESENSRKEKRLQIGDTDDRDQTAGQE